MREFSEKFIQFMKPGEALLGIVIWGFDFYRELKVEQVGATCRAFLDKIAISQDKGAVIKYIQPASTTEAGSMFI